MGENRSKTKKKGIPTYKKMYFLSPILALTIFGKYPKKEEGEANEVR